MTDDQLKSVVLEALKRIAPETEPATLDSSRDLREQLDLDSMDFLNFVVQLHERLNVDIPEVEYGRLATLDGCLKELRARLGPP